MGIASGREGHARVTCHTALPCLLALSIFKHLVRLRAQPPIALPSLHVELPPLSLSLMREEKHLSEAEPLLPLLLCLISQSSKATSAMAPDLLLLSGIPPLNLQIHLRTTKRPKHSLKRSFSPPSGGTESEVLECMSRECHLGLRQKVSSPFKRL